MAAGDAALAAVLVGSVFISSPDAARGNVLLFQLISVAPFAVVAPLIGPTLDRVPGGRRFAVQVTAIARAVLYLIMIAHVNDVLLFPLVFGVMVLQKTYSVSKSALVPLVVRDEDELVEANSKLGLISGVLGAIAVGPLTGLGHLAIGLALVPGAMLFVAAAFTARRLPREAVAAAPVEAAEREELRSFGILLGAGAFALIRASVGFLTFHLLFWMRGDYGLVWLGLAVAAGAAGSMIGNVLA
ncbi:MAG: MFS transporter, partial [Ilumatobacteraceae bacterium]